MQRVDREFYIAGTANNSFDAHLFWTQWPFYDCVYAIRIWPGDLRVAVFFLVVLFWFTVDCHYACDQQCPCIFYLPLEEPSLRA